MTQFVIGLEIPGVLRATFDWPPINLVNDEFVAEVAAPADRMESDPGVKVLADSRGVPGSAMIVG
jgi:hypothetical protein